MKRKGKLLIPYYATFEYDALDEVLTRKGRKLEQMLLRVPCIERTCTENLSTFELDRIVSSHLLRRRTFWDTHCVEFLALLGFGAVLSTKLYFPKETALC